MKYRPEIDGLRAVAVLSVILYHAGFLVSGHNLFQGGFIGVDVFFVISGYLITSILLREMKEGRFSFLRFYERRARRILPALYVVLFACLPFAWVLMLREPMEAFGRSLLAALFYFSNHYFWGFVDYFNDNVHQLPLLHTWSLSVEEQYYILFPLILSVLWKKTRRFLAPVFLVGFFVSLGAADWISRARPEAAFYLLPTRGWELLAGSLLAVFEKEGKSRKDWPSFCFKLLPSAGLTIILFFVGGMSSDVRHPSLYTLLPVLGASFVIGFGGRGDFASRLLASKPFVGIGLISYSLYLWHYPLFAFVHIYEERTLSLSCRAGLIAATFICAWLSWRFVERPFRNRKKIRARTLLAFLIPSSLLLAGFAAGAVVSNGYQTRLPPIIKTMEDETKLSGFYVDGKDCFHESCLIGIKGGKPSVALKGDSHAGVFVTALHEVLLEANLSGVTMAEGELLLQKFPDFYPHHEKQQENLEKHLKMLKDPSIKTIILSSRATMRIEKQPFDNQEGGVERQEVWSGGRNEAEKESLKALIREAIFDQLRQNKKIILVYPIPEVGFNVPKVYTRKILNRQKPELSTSYDVYRERNKAAFDLYDGLGEHPHLLRIYPHEMLCDTLIKGRCAVLSAEGKPLYFDDDHLTVDAARAVMRRIVEKASEKWGRLD